MKKRTMLVWMGAFIAIAAAGMGLRNVSAAEGTAEEIRDLVTFADQQMMNGAGDSRLTLKWYGDVKLSDQSLNDLGDRFSASLGLAAGEVQSGNGHTIYETSADDQANSSSIAESLILLQEDGSTPSVIVKLEGKSSDWERISDRQKDWNQRLGKLSVNGRWLISVQGDIPRQPDSYDAEKSLLQQAQSGLQAKPVDIYQDKGIINVSFYSPKFKETAAADVPVSLQAAMHYNSLTGQWGLTVGTPMLTGEF